MKEVPVTFYVPGSPEWDDVIDRGVLFSPDEQWSRFNTNTAAWPIQTYLQLRCSGYSCSISSSLPQEGIVICVIDHLTLPLVSPTRTIVCCLGDRHPHPLADFSVSQNPFQPCSGVNTCIPLWSQTNLKKRIQNRDDIRNIDYFGKSINLNRSFFAPEFNRELSSLGMNFRYRQDSEWNDFSTTDVATALRPQPREDWILKPPTKLINAWKAGCPAIVTPEPAYLAVRKSELDFLTAESADEVVARLKLLKDRPDLYEKMVLNGFVRYREFEDSNLQQKWIEFMENTVKPWHERYRSRPASFPGRIHFIHKVILGAGVKGLERLGLGSFRKNRIVATAYRNFKRAQRA